MSTFVVKLKSTEGLCETVSQLSFQPNAKCPESVHAERLFNEMLSRHFQGSKQHKRETDHPYILLVPVPSYTVDRVSTSSQRLFPCLFLLWFLFLFPPPAPLPPPFFVLFELFPPFLPVLPPRLPPWNPLPWLRPLPDDLGAHDGIKSRGLTSSTRPPRSGTLPTTAPLSEVRPRISVTGVYIASTRDVSAWSTSSKVTPSCAS